MNNQTIEELNTRKLDNCLFCIYTIPIPIYFKGESNVSSPKTLLLFYGCNIRGRRKYISSVILEDFDKSSDWYNYFISFKRRNINIILYALLPNNQALKRAIELVFPQITIFNSFSESANKLTRYFTYRYSSQVFCFIKRIFVSKSIDDYYIAYNEFNELFSNSKFLIDLLNNDFVDAKKNYSFDYILRKHVFAFYFIRELSKKLIVISHSKPYFSSINEFVSLTIPIIQIIESKNYCPKKEWIQLINHVYKEKEDLIKCYL